MEQRNLSKYKKANNFKMGRTFSMAARYPVNQQKNTFKLIDLKLELDLTKVSLRTRLQIHT